MAERGDAVPPLGLLLASTGFGTGLRFRQLLSPLGLHPREFAVLRAVAAAEGMSQQACGDALGVAPSRIVALVDELEGKGLVVRRPHPRDRRVRALHLTAKGRKVLTRAFEAAAANESALFAAFSDDERAQLRRLLVKAAAALGVEPGTHPGMGTD